MSNADRFSSTRKRRSRRVGRFSDFRQEMSAFSIHSRINGILHEGHFKQTDYSGEDRFGLGRSKGCCDRHRIPCYLPDQDTIRQAPILQRGHCNRSTVIVNKGQRTRRAGGCAPRFRGFDGIMVQYSQSIRQFFRSTSVFADRE